MLLSGKTIQEEMLVEQKKNIESNKLLLKLVIIQVGDDFASTKYINNKIIFAQKIGIKTKLIKHEPEVTTDKLIDEISLLNQDEEITGIIVQLPLPKHLNSDLITQAISPLKDVDGFHSSNIGKAYLNQESLLSATPSAIMKMLNFYDVDVAGKNIVVVGSSNYVGKMIAVLLINKGATVTSCNSGTKNIQTFIDSADVFITAIGQPHFFKRENFLRKSELVIIDIGISRLNGKVVGDVDTFEVEKEVRAISPVPGGVGPMTITMLMDNVICAKNIGSKNENNNG